MANQTSLFRKIIQNIGPAIKGSKQDFTKGSIRKAIFLLSIPMILEMVMESLFAVVDMFFVAKISVEAVAAVGLTESVMTIFYSVAIGLSMATTAMVARRVGEKKPKRAAKAAGQAITLAVTISIAVACLGFFFAGDILELMGGSPSLVETGESYTKIIFATNLCIVLIYLNNAIFRGAGDAAIAMRTLWISNGLNMILDPIFIFGLGPIPEMGVAGAAIATTLGRTIGVCYQFYHMFGDRSIIQLKAKYFVPIKATFLKLLSVALGGTGQFLISSASWIFMVRIISDFGSAAVAGYTIAFRVVIFTILPSWGLAMAAAALVGQNLGAGKPERAEESVWKTARWNMFFLGSVGLVFYIFAPQIIGIFTPDTEAISNGVMGLRLICIGYLTFAYGMVISQAFNGAGDTKTPTWINIIAFWLIEIPLAYFLAKWLEWGPQGVYIAITVAFACSAAIGIFMFRKGNWKTVEI